MIVCVNCDPHAAHEGAVDIPWDLDLPERFGVRDLLTGHRWEWGHGPNYVRLDPQLPAHVLAVEP